MSTSTSKPVGWFSRRHATNTAHTAAVAAYQSAHGRSARRRAAEERAAKYEARVVRFAIDHETDLDTARVMLRVADRLGRAILRKTAVSR